MRSARLSLGRTAHSGFQRDSLTLVDGRIQRRAELALWTAKGNVREFPMPAAGASDGGAVAVGPEGAIWFTEGDGQNIVTRIGRIITDGIESGFPLPNAIPNTGKNAIVCGPGGALWFSYGDNDNGGPSAVSRITTDGDVTAYSLDPGIYPWDIAVGPDGAFWLVEGPDLSTTPPSSPHIGRFAP